MSRKDQRTINEHRVLYTTVYPWWVNVLPRALSSGDVDLLKEECNTLREECVTLKEDNSRLSDRLQQLQRQRTR